MCVYIYLLDGVLITCIIFQLFTASMVNFTSKLHCLANKEGL